MTSIKQKIVYAEVVEKVKDQFLDELVNLNYLDDIDNEVINLDEESTNATSRTDTD